MPGRFIRIDLVDRLAPHVPEPVAQVIVGVGCTVLAILAREAVDAVFPGAGPFALIMPFVLFATLFGRWGAGLGVMLISALFAWYFVLPVRHSFAFENPADGPRVLINVVSGFLIVALAEYFRRVVRRVLTSRDAIARERRLLLEELDHRVKNNFAMVSAMVRIELRGAPEAARPSLTAMLGRIESIARAHEALYRNGASTGAVPMRPYLTNLCASLNAAYMGEHRLTAEVSEIALPRDDAVGIGLLINELCVNAVKHAFPNRKGGAIHVSLLATDQTLTITVADDGIGIQGKPTRDGGLGQGIISGLADQIGGTLERVPSEVGTTFRLVIPRKEVQGATGRVSSG